MIAKVIPEKCIACGNCEITCPHDCINVEETCEIDASECIGCGSCVNNCMQKALILVEE